MQNSDRSLKSALVISLMALMIISCDSGKTDKIEKDEASSTVNYLALGDSISIIAQQTLLSNVSREMKSGGPENAVNFCNLNASKLMDSISRENNVVISRVTSKPRNTSNQASAFELNLLNDLKSTGSSDIVVTHNFHTIYYKSIKLGMPTCIKCHGVVGSDIDDETFSILNERYPNDAAINYRLGDYRGAWKIEFKD